MPKNARPADVRLIVGLGNPGPEYAHTRHSAGYAVVDALADSAGVHYWKSQAGALTAQVTLAGTQVVLAKPQTFMNECGGPVAKLVHQLHLTPANLLVVHDDVDVPDGTLRVKFGGGHDGHNGLRSIINKLGSHDFSRLRCGVGRPPGRMSVADYALRPLKGSYLEEFQVTVQDAASACELCVRGGIPAAMERFS